ncbi:MAG: c-type cytochrome [Terasakiella sp.]|uniref:c-type cytochrome n=1 Tax=unclassified Terasakiella TaxID=2614952 RepID=UPI003B00D9DD
MLKRAFLICTLFIGTQSALADNLDRAIEIVEEKCHLCHGTEGESSSAIYPRLAAQHEEYIAKQLADFQAGRRTGTMNEMAQDLTPDEMVALGKYFAAKPPLSHRVRDEEFAAVGQYLYMNGNKYSGVTACKTCHGNEGKGTQKLPRLAGQHKRYLADQLTEFHNRNRTNDNAVMHSIASKLTEMEIQALATYISGMK